jgi:hypothetical protein
MEAIESAREQHSRLTAGLEVFDRADLPGALHAHRIGDRGEPSLTEALQGHRIFAQVELGADEDDGNAGRVMRYLGDPLRVLDIVRGTKRPTHLCPDVLKTGGANDGEAD